MSKSKGKKAGKKRVASGGETWLEELESTVRQAGETLADLRREKADLVEQVKTLEARVGELEGGAAAGKKAAGEKGGEAADAWREERQEIRDRVETLTERLEGLLEEE